MGLFGFGKKKVETSKEEKGWIQIGIDFCWSEDPTKEIISLLAKLCNPPGFGRPYISQVDKDEKGWHIFFAPNESDGLYKLEEINRDWPILWMLNECVKEKFNLKGCPPSIIITFNNKKPAMVFREDLMTIVFNVEDRIKYDGNKLAEKLFGNLSEKLKKIKGGKPTRELTITGATKRSEWLRQVSGLLAMERLK